MSGPETTEELFGNPSLAIEIARWIKAYAAWFREADASGHAEINDAFRAGYIHGCSDAMSEIDLLRERVRWFQGVLSRTEISAAIEAEIANAKAGE